VTATADLGREQGVHTWWQTLHERLRAGFWVLPLSMSVAAGVIATFTLWLDDRYDGTLGGLLSAGGPVGAQNVLTTVAASMVTVGATVLSVTVVAMQLASTQFGPRILTNFVRDRVNQAALGSFVAVFVNALLVLRRTNDNPATIPRISLMVTLLLTFGAVAMLVVFVHHIATTIQAMNIVGRISRDVQEVMDRRFPDPHDADEARPAGSDVDLEGRGSPVLALRSGYLQLIDLEKLLGLCEEHDLVLRFAHRPGKFVVDGTPVAHAWSGDGRQPADLDDGLGRELAGAFVTGPRRTHDQDAEFPAKQLVEVAVRSLSPAINDPITACACTDHLGAALCRLAGRREPPTTIAGGDGRPRLVHGDPLTFGMLVGVCFDAIRQSADFHVVVYIHLLESLERLAGCLTREEQAEPVRREADLVLERAEQVVAQEADRDVVRRRHERVLDALDARW
jgi:uncharacterized membrane protein